MLVLRIFRQTQLIDTTETRAETYVCCYWNLFFGTQLTFIEREHGNVKKKKVIQLIINIFLIKIN
jgi:hypothetical protein